MGAKSPHIFLHMKTYTITLIFNDYKKLQRKKLIVYNSLKSAVNAYGKYFYAMKEKNLVFDTIIHQIQTEQEVIDAYEKFNDIKEVL